MLQTLAKKGEEEDGNTELQNEVIGNWEQQSMMGMETEGGGQYKGGVGG